MLSEYPAWGADRPRGILSQADREFLLASDDEREENYSRQAKGNRERAIRERLENAILDFSMIFSRLDDRNLEFVFNPAEIDNTNAMRHGMRDLLAMIYLETRKPKYGHESTDVIQHFDNLLRSAVYAAEAEWRGIDPDETFSEIISRISVEFSVLEPQPVDVAIIADKIASRALYEFDENEARFYLFVQWRSGGQIDVGEGAADAFLENVDELTDEGAIDVGTVGI